MLSYHKRNTIIYQCSRENNMNNIIGIRDSGNKEFDIDIVSYDNLNTTINTNKKKIYFINLYTVKLPKFNLLLSTVKLVKPN